MLRELFNISAFPSLLQAEYRPFFSKVGTVLKTYGLIFLSLIAVGWLIYLADYLVINVFHHKSIQAQYNFTMDKMMKKAGMIKALLYICLIGPILEELVFRFSLSFKKINLAVSIAVAIFMFGNLIPAVKNLGVTIGLGYALAIRIAFSAIVCFALIRLLPDDRKFTPAFKNTVIILSIIIFGLMHISNFIPLQWALIWIYPIYVLPQMLMGWGITYVRFKNGFIWGIALHCLINSISMFIYTHAPKEMELKRQHIMQNRGRAKFKQVILHNRD